MKNRLLALQDQLSSSYWFIPAVMAVLAVILSVLMINIDEGIGRDLRWMTGLVYVDSPEGARAVLSTVASSMITVAGVVFSLTMVVLSLTSQQYGPLVLVHFMRDRGNQFVLGVFTATFIYCLLVLRTIRGGEENYFIPHMSVLVGLGLAIASLAVLIYFIHHISEAIQGPNIIASLSDDLLTKIHDLFPAQLGKEISRPGDTALQEQYQKAFAGDGCEVRTATSGYLQLINEDELLRVARHHHLVIKLEVQPGEFLFRGQILVHVLPAEARSQAVIHAIRDAFVLGSRRTPAQDIDLIFTQLSALAVRSLSPAINDPFTAMMVIDHLGDALCAVLRGQRPSIYRYDDDEQLRVIAHAVNFETLLRSAFDQIRHYGQGDLKLDVRLLEVLLVLWQCTDKPDLHRLLERYMANVYQEGQQRLTNSEDERLNQAYSAVMREIHRHQSPESNGAGISGWEPEKSAPTQS